jgi:hypothetical protein
MYYQHRWRQGWRGSAMAVARVSDSQPGGEASASAICCVSPRVTVSALGGIAGPVRFCILEHALEAGV